MEGVSGATNKPRTSSAAHYHDDREKAGTYHLAWLKSLGCRVLRLEVTGTVTNLVAAVTAALTGAANNPYEVANLIPLSPQNGL